MILNPWRLDGHEKQRSKHPVQCISIHKHHDDATYLAMAIVNSRGACSTGGSVGRQPDTVVWRPSIEVSQKFRRGLARDRASRGGGTSAQLVLNPPSQSSSKPPGSLSSVTCHQSPGSQRLQHIPTPPTMPTTIPSTVLYIHTIFTHNLRRLLTLKSLGSFRILLPL